MNQSKGCARGFKSVPSSNPTKPPTMDLTNNNVDFPYHTKPNQTYPTIPSPASRQITLKDLFKPKEFLGELLGKHFFLFIKTLIKL